MTFSDVGHLRTVHLSIIVTQLGDFASCFRNLCDFTVHIHLEVTCVEQLLLLLDDCLTVLLWLVYIAQ